LETTKEILFTIDHVKLIHFASPLGS
jgi:hypothetical protein